MYDNDKMETAVAQSRYYYENLASERPKFDDVRLNIYSKRAALKVAPSVLAIGYYSDEEEIIHGSGTIIESNDIMSIVLSSANLRRHCSEVVTKKRLINDLKVIVYSWDGKSYEGKLLAYNCYYNLVAISFHSESPLLTATLAHVDDSMSLQFSTSSSELLSSYSRSCNLTPGYKVVAMGRYFYMPFDLMAAPGAYCIGRCERNYCKYKCTELFKTNCRITKCGDGGPLINHSGEIIGFAYEGDYYGFSSLPFMPINIAYKWWEYYKKYGKYRRPFMGMKAANLYATDLDIAERLIRKFPSICEGIIIEKVMKGFSAEMAGLRVNDVIIECCGKTIHSFLEFFEIIWDKVGDLIELTVVRQNNAEPVHLKMLIVDATPDRFNRWPCDSDYNDNYYGDYYDNYNSQGFD
ncbi:putative protease Do-like 14 [Apium graveolens]|uniref:putative protease Do-like 14 n=1 Tax=Apium graveolens TaxID=4045 RepID=UPI003D7ACCC8